MLNFIENFLFKIDLKVVSIMKRKSVISLILRVGGSANNGSWAGSGDFHSSWVRSGSDADIGFFTTVKLD